jgi:hypothetical protein
VSYWYEVIAPVQDGPDDCAYEQIGPQFHSMILAINFARRHEDSKVYMVLNDNERIDTVELPVNGYPPFSLSKVG